MTDQHTQVWEELQSAGAEPDTAQPSSVNAIGRAKNWWAQAPLQQKGIAALAVFLVLVAGMAITVGVVSAAGKMLRQSPPAPAAAPAVTVTPTSSPTATPKPTPTPLPTFIVWAPHSKGAYVRSAPSPLAKPLTVVPNGTTVVDLGESTPNGQYVWYHVKYPVKQGWGTGWMANVVVWRLHPSAYLKKRAALFEDNEGKQGAFLEWLPAGTPLVKAQVLGVWARVTIPDGKSGLVLAREIKK